MKHNTGIEWTHIPGYTGETWNPVVGCSIASKGCTNCYAMRFANNRLDGNPKTTHYAGTTEKVNGNPVWTGKVSLASEKTLLKPLTWREPRSIFVNSMGDLFHEDVPDEWIDQVFAIAALCPQHIFIILTKRAERMHNYMPEEFLKGDHGNKRWDQVAYWRISKAAEKISPKKYKSSAIGACDWWPLPNVWLGVSAEDQATADERIPFLIDTPATVRFASCEPLLGTIDLENIIYPIFAEEMAKDKYFPRISFDALRGHMKGPDDVGLPKLDWVIAGGESGPNARPMHHQWARSLRDQCQAANVPFFFKQWGEWASLCHMTEDERRNLDKPNRIAKDGEDQEDLNELYGVTDRYELKVMTTDGISRDLAPQAFADISAMSIYRTGKKKAGHLLDGVEHFNWPKCVKTLEGVEG